jgi:hypothetical protein
LLKLSYELSNKLDIGDNRFHRFLTKSITEEFFAYLLSDINTFLFGFQADFDLLEYWYWSNFLQTSSYHEKDGSINMDFFSLMLLRISVLSEVLLGETYDQCPFSCLNDVWHFQLNKQGETVSTAIKKVVKILKSNNSFNYWYASARIVCENKSFKMSWASFVMSNGEPDKNTFDIKLIELLGSSEGHNKIRGMNREEILKMSANFYDRLNTGDIIEYSRDTFHNEYNYLYSLIYASLTILMERNEKDIKLIKRNENGTIIPNSNNDSHHVFIDPNGGIYIPNYLTRKWYFKYSAAITNSLIDFALKYKKQFAISRN